MRSTKRIALGLVLLAATVSGGLGQAQGQETGDLTVVFTGLTTDTGKVGIALVNSKAGYDDEDKYGFRSAWAEVKEFQSQHTFTNIPLGTYSIKAFQDLNGDERLNKGMFGIPLEPDGFSNDARGMWGPPPYENTLCRITARRSVISIKLSR